MFSENLKEKIAQVITDAGIASPEAGLGKLRGPVDRQQLLLESRCFTEIPLDNRKCASILSKALYLLSSGQELTKEETSTLFFASTRLFQSQSQHVRRLLHVLIKNLVLVEEESFVVTQCLVKDMSSTNHILRGNAIRTASRVVDSAMIHNIEKYIKNAIVDKDPFVASSALVSSIQLCRNNVEAVKRWVPEIMECLTSKHPMVQFHALALSHELRKNDRVALHKIIQQLSSQSLKSPMADCMLVRYSKQLILAERGSPLEPSLLTFLEWCLKHKSPAVSYDAARALVDLAAIDHYSHLRKTGKPQATAKMNLKGAVTALEGLLNSPRVVVRYAAISCINKLAHFRPDLAIECAAEIEPLFSDTNHLVAVTALTTTLKLGPTLNIEKLLKEVSHLIADVSDVHRYDIVEAVTQLALNDPDNSTASLIIGFLSGQFHGVPEGGLPYKQSLVTALLTIARNVPSVHDETLLFLCDYIEDCSHLPLSCRILSALAEEVPKTQNPGRFLRYVYNRAIVELAPVRGATVSALTEFALKCPELRRDIFVLLQSLEHEAECEVRDRIRFGVKLIASSAEVTDDPDLATTASGFDESDRDSVSSSSTSRNVASRLEDGDVRELDELLDNGLNFSLDGLLETMVDHYGSAQSGPTSYLDMNGLLTDEEFAKKHAAESPLTNTGGGMQTTTAASSSSTMTMTMMMEKMSISPPAIETAIASLVGQDDLVSNLGEHHHSTLPEYICEKEAEYIVQVVKHYFSNNSDAMVLEFMVSNTLEKVFLKTIGIDLRSADAHQCAYQILKSTKIEELKSGETKSLYYFVKKSPTLNSSATFKATLTFVFQELGDMTGGYKDTYALESFVVRIGDSLAPIRTDLGNFEEKWNSMQHDHDDHDDDDTHAHDDDGSQSHSFVVRSQQYIKNILLAPPSSVISGKNWPSLAVQIIKGRLNMYVCNNDELTSITNNPSKIEVLLRGEIFDDIQILIKILMVASSAKGILAKIMVRAEHQNNARKKIGAIGESTSKIVSRNLTRSELSEYIKKTIDGCFD